MGHHVELLAPADSVWSGQEEGVSIRTWQLNRTKLIGPFVNMSRQRKLAAEFAAGAGDAVTVIPDVCAVSWPYPLATAKVIKFTCTHLLQKFEAQHDKPKFRRAVAERIMVPRADAFTAISRRTAEVSAQLFKMDPNSIEVIPNTVDTELYKPDSTVPRRPKLLLYVGTVCAKKGALETVDALNRLVQDDPEYRLIMIGRNGVDLDGRPDFVGRLRREFPATCEKHVEFMGHVANDELPGFFRRVEMAVLPSYYESFGRTTIEAMACGTPVVRSDAPPAAEIIDDGVDGMLCKTRDAANLALVVRDLHHRPQVRESIAISARQKAVKVYSLDAVCRHTERFLKDVLSNG